MFFGCICIFSIENTIQRSRRILYLGNNIFLCHVAKQSCHRWRFPKSLYYHIAFLYLQYAVFVRLCSVLSAQCSVSCSRSISDSFNLEHSVRGLHQLPIGHYKFVNGSANSTCCKTIRHSCQCQGWPPAHPGIIRQTLPPSVWVLEQRNDLESHTTEKKQLTPRG